MRNIIFALAVAFQACSPAPAFASYDDFLFQPPNVCMCGPASGGSGPATFRSQVAADIPALPYASSTLANGKIYIGNGGVATAETPSGDWTISTTGVATLKNTGPGAGSYTSANITIDAQGRVTAASNGAGGGGSLSVTTLSATGTVTPSASAFSGYNVTVTGTQTLADCTTSGPWVAQFSNFAGGSLSVTLAAGGSNTFNDGSQSGLTSYVLTDPGTLVQLDCNSGGTIYVHVLE